MVDALYFPQNNGLNHMAAVCCIKDLEGLEVAGVFRTHGLDVGMKLIRRRDFAQCDGQVVVVNTAASSSD